MSPSHASPPLITFLSDYGHDDEFVGICHGVIARRCPHARVIDVTHGVPAGDVRWGALVLARALAFLPAGVHLAVVDPGVGATGARARRAVALRARQKGRVLVGPDNGLLMPAAEALGGVAEAVEISHSSERLQPVSATFHGRDIFAPIAAALAAGAQLAQVGEALDPAQLCRLEISRASVRDGALHARVLRIDHFGNVILNADAAVASELGVRPGAKVAVRCRAAATHRARVARTFADAAEGELVLYEDSLRLLALAVNRGSAAELLGARPGEEIEVLSA